MQRAQKTERAWSSQSLASRAKHRFFYQLIHFGGWRVAYLALFFVVLAYTLTPSMRARCAPYLARRFPDRFGLGRWVDAFKLYHCFGMVLVDRAAVGILKQGRVETSEANRRLFLDLLAEGNGLIALTAHTGAWQWVLSGLEFLPVQKYVLYHRDPADVDRHYFEHSQEGHPIRFIDPEAAFGGVIEMTQALKAGGLVCAMGDRVMSGAQSRTGVEFLGGKINLPTGIYHLSAATGAPVAVIVAPRTGPMRARVDIVAVLRPCKRHERSPGAYAAEATAFAQALEQFVACNPYQFFNFFDMWETQPG